MDEAILIDLDDAQNNDAVNTEACINSAASIIKVLVIPTNEEIVIANKTFELAK